MVCADDIPLSPAKGQNVVGIHFTWKRRHNEVLEVLPYVEEVLSKFNAKPHFGKVFLMSGNILRKLFGRDYDRVKQVMQENDPTGKFHNNFIKKYFY